jgi:hypothetical protein
MGAPPRISDMGGGGVRLSRLALGPPRLRGAKRPLLTDTAAAPSPKRGMGLCAKGRLLGFAGEAIASRGWSWCATKASRHQKRAGWREAPTGGGRMGHPARPMPKAAKRQGTGAGQGGEQPRLRGHNGQRPLTDKQGRYAPTDCKKVRASDVAALWPRPGRGAVPRAPGRGQSAATPKEGHFT